MTRYAPCSSLFCFVLLCCVLLYIFCFIAILFIFESRSAKIFFINSFYCRNVIMLLSNCPFKEARKYVVARLTVCIFLITLSPSCNLLPVLPPSPFLPLPLLLRVNRQRNRHRNEQAMSAVHLNGLAKLVMYPLVSSHFFIVFYIFFQFVFFLM